MTVKTDLLQTMGPLDSKAVITKPASPGILLNLYNLLHSEKEGFTIVPNDATNVYWEKEFDINDYSFFEEIHDIVETALSLWCPIITRSEQQFTKNADKQFMFDSFHVKSGDGTWLELLKSTAFNYDHSNFIDDFTRERDNFLKDFLPDLSEALSHAINNLEKKQTKTGEEIKTILCKKSTLDKLKALKQSLENKENENSDIKPNSFNIEELEYLARKALKLFGDPICEKEPLVKESLASVVSLLQFCSDKTHAFYGYLPVLSDLPQCRDVILKEIDKIQYNPLFGPHFRANKKNLQKEFDQVSVLIRLLDSIKDNINADHCDDTKLISDLNKFRKQLMEVSKMQEIDPENSSLFKKWTIDLSDKINKTIGVTQYEIIKGLQIEFQPHFKKCFSDNKSMLSDVITNLFQRKSESRTPLLQDRENFNTDLRSINAAFGKLLSKTNERTDTLPKEDLQDLNSLLISAKLSNIPSKSTKKFLGNACAQINQMLPEDTLASSCANSNFFIKNMNTTANQELEELEHSYKK